MISPGTDVSGSSLPSTAHSISRAFGTAASTTTLRSNCERQSRSPAPASSGVFTFEMPTLDPRLAGLTNTGSPSGAICFSTRLRSRSHSGRHEAVPVADRQPASREQNLHDRLVHARRRGQHAGADIRNVREFEQALHGAVLAVRPMQDREHHVDAERVEHCRLAAAQAVAPPPPRPAPAESPQRRTAQSAPASGKVHRPSFSMRMAIGSYLFRSMCLKIDAADVTDTSCSPDRPPKMIPTRNFFTQR